MITSKETLDEVLETLYNKEIRNYYTINEAKMDLEEVYETLDFYADFIEFVKKHYSMLRKWLKDAEEE